MNQLLLGFLLFIALILPPVANLMESVMIIHMHMQMPLLVIAGFLMAHRIIRKFPTIFNTYNENGIPGILLFMLILTFWMMPRTMDEALTNYGMELFKFFSLTFLAGVPLRDSWSKLHSIGKNALFIFYSILFLALGWVYIQANNQLCNNYLVVDQIILGWGFITTAICLVIYLFYAFLVDPSQYE